MAQVDPPLTSEKLRDVIQDAHLNFLVGAGGPADLFRPLGAIETVLTELSEQDDITDPVKVARASIYALFFDEVVDKNGELIEGTSEPAKKVLSDYQAFATTLNRILLRRRSSLLHKQVNVFTTNIDIAFEVAFEALALESNDGFAGKFVPKFNTANFGSLRYRRSLQYENVSEVPTFNLLKVHGSASWLAPEGPIENGELPDIGFDRTLEQIAATRAKLELARRHLIKLPQPLAIDTALAAAADIDVDQSVLDFMAEYEKLAIVNPTKEKFQSTVLNENYYDLLRIFANEMEKENSVLFVVGFSFRDEHIRQVVIRAARTNPTLQVIVFAHSDREVESLKGLIPVTAVKNGNVLVVAPKEDSSLDLKTITEQYFVPIVPAPKPKPDVQVDVNVTGQADVDVAQR